MYLNRERPAFLSLLEGSGRESGSLWCGRPENALNDGFILARQMPHQRRTVGQTTLAYSS